MASWNHIYQIPSKKYRCGFCSSVVASDRGFSDSRGPFIYVCPHCGCPTFFEINGKQIPGIPPGNDVNHLPSGLEKLYREARLCVSVNAFTASVLISRKMLMNIAVEQGAPEGKTFIFYVEYLSTSGFIPPNGRQWVDHIRKKGNEATHEIALMSSGDAEELISFVEMLLKFIYEFPAKIPQTPVI
ncbi:DUF4145 domain-containing protein [Roseateles chitinivorans]|uniref:DUF4145 domain-containing protein n=1 Tax=Roseateles chitinivorans TaxID=2917965 RepID=UPI003D6676D0